MWKLIISLMLVACLLASSLDVPLTEVSDATQKQNSTTCYNVVTYNSCRDSIFVAFCYDVTYDPVFDGCCRYYIQVAQDCIPQMASDAKALNFCGKEVDLIDERATKLYEFCLHNQ